MAQKTGLIAIAVIVIVIIAASAVYLVTQPEAAPGEGEGSLKFAVVLSGAINDMGYCQTAYGALLAVEEEFAIEADYSEGLYNPPDAGRAAREYADAGYDMIHFHGVAFGGIVKEIASEFPDITFSFRATGEDPEEVKEFPPNVGLMYPESFKTNYLQGALAGLMTKTNKIGFIGPYAAPFVVRMININKAALKMENPDAELIYIFTGNFDDPLLAKEAALSLIEINDCDIIFTVLGAGNHGIIEAVEEYEDVYLMNNHADCWDLAPGKFLNASLERWDLMMIDMIRSDMEGEFRGKLHIGEFPEYAHLSSYHGMVPPEIADRIDEIKEDIVSGEIEVPMNYELE
jgi:basic membrane protein A